jgi:hypothetical protein
MIVFYHAALPIDFYYLFSKVWLYRNRRCRIVADKFVFKIPGSFDIDNGTFHSMSMFILTGLSTLLEALEIQPATSIMCQTMLEQGHVLAISPGKRQTTMTMMIVLMFRWRSRGTIQ